MSKRIKYKTGEIIKSKEHNTVFTYLKDKVTDLYDALFAPIRKVKSWQK
jgi:hypothetical protein